MGKRELLLIAAFLAVGALVYQFTAPEREPGQNGFSLGRVIDEIKREVRGRPASAESTMTATHPVAGGINELRVTLQNTPVTIIGEARPDIASELWVHSNGVDEAEAKALIARSVLSIEPAGPTMVVGLRYPPEGSQRGRLTLRVPSAMRVQFGPTNVRVEVSGVGGVEFESARRETIVRQISGHAAVTHRGGDLTVEGVGTIRLSTRGSNVRLQRVEADATLQIVAGEFRGSELLGPIDLEGTDAEITIEDLQKSRGPLRLRAVNGQLRIRGLRTQARIEGRGTEIELVMDQPAPVAVFNSGDRITLTPPRGGYSLDASTDGELVLPDALKKAVAMAPAQEGAGTRASGDVNGGGPTITLRNPRGEIRIIARD